MLCFHSSDTFAAPALFEVSPVDSNLAFALDQLGAVAAGAADTAGAGIVDVDTVGADTADAGTAVVVVVVVVVVVAAAAAAASAAAAAAAFVPPSPLVLECLVLLLFPLHRPSSFFLLCQKP